MTWTDKFYTLLFSAIIIAFGLIVLMGLGELVLTVAKAFGLS